MSYTQYYQVLKAAFRSWTSVAIPLGTGAPVVNDALGGSVPTDELSQRRQLDYALLYRSGPMTFTVRWREITLSVWQSVDVNFAARIHVHDITAERFDDAERMRDAEGRQGLDNGKSIARKPLITSLLFGAAGKDGCTATPQRTVTGGRNAPALPALLPNSNLFNLGLSMGSDSNPSGKAP